MAVASTTKRGRRNVRSGEEGVILRIVREIAAREGIDPVDAPPLWENLDPEALDNLVESTQADVTVSFTIEEWRVVIANGNVEVIEP